MKREAALRLFLLLGLSVSLLLLRDYLTPAPLVCGEGGGCEAVKSSDYASFFGIPTPVFGALYFSLALGLSLWPRMRRLLSLVTLAGAAGALGFIALQVWVVGAICPYCMVVDSSALLVAVLAFVQPRPPAPSAPNLAATAFGALVALSVPLLWSPPRAENEPEEALASGLPEVLAAEQRPGVITVVEFLDPDCDACRTYDSFLREWQARAGDKIRVVRKLVSREERAQAAARALCCAEQLGAGDAMAEALLSGPLPAPSDVEGLAASLNLDPVLYRGCVDSPASSEQLARDAESASALGVVSLPTIWVGGERVDGHRSPEELQTCLERALGAL